MSQTVTKTGSTYLTGTSSTPGVSGLTLSSSSYPLANSKNDYTNTTYARYYASITGTKFFYWGFAANAFSSIPDSATITKITLQYKLYTTSSSYWSSRVMYLRYGGMTGTSYGSGTITATSTSTQSVAITPSSLTGSTFKGRSLYATAYLTCSKSGTSCYIRAYGARVTVAYSYNQVQYQVTVSSDGNGTVGTALSATNALDATSLSYLASTSSSTSASYWYDAGSNVDVLVPNVDGYDTTFLTDNNITSQINKPENSSYIFYKYCLPQIATDHTVSVTHDNIAEKSDPYEHEPPLGTAKNIQIFDGSASNQICKISDSTVDYVIIYNHGYIFKGQYFDKDYLFNLIENEEEISGLGKYIIYYNDGSAETKTETSDFPTCQYRTDTITTEKQLSCAELIETNDLNSVLLPNYSIQSETFVESGNSNALKESGLLFTTDFIELGYGANSDIDTSKYN